MNQKVLFALWGVLYVLCAALGFIPEPEGALRVLLMLIALCFFVPPLLLSRCGDRTAVKLVRNLAALWLIFAAALLVANILSVGASVWAGNVLYCLLVIVASPMICSQYWVAVLFGWAYVLFDSIRMLRRR